MAPVTVCEYARLTTASIAPTLRQASISQSAFDWLCQESARLSASGASLVQLQDRCELRLDNYVGVLESPCGLQIEILPKSLSEGESRASARRVLRRMIMKSLGLRAREARATQVEKFEAPLTEWVMGEFLAELDRLVKRGLRFDYRSQREEQRFLRGWLDVTRQMRQPPSRQHLFRIEHDVYGVDRAENRLVRRALDVVCAATRDSENWRIAHELVTYLARLPSSTDVAGDFRRWRDNRLMAHYRPIRPWCELILSGEIPMSTLGKWHGPSLLFPMELLFESYVEVCMREQFAAHCVVTRTPSSRYLCRHMDQDWFKLKPDFMVSSEEHRWVMDTKWKRLDDSLSDRTSKYALSQADFYQLFAYGQNYLLGEGEMFLIFPRTNDFQQPLPVFEFLPGLKLWVVPFDLDKEHLELPQGSELRQAVLSSVLTSGDRLTRVS